ncbi:ABC transporter permease [Blastococcus sp. PRF04-17]|uniref:ABC transporter permease n=1 Tax=Blastococcus sp. PRF04-17 TaxID=2933797 RepID=UPI001FF4E873|nr:ABC transporter permease [Blastococcus sp. PRF04-17]UOY03348.1 ABC transporter permease [Blastococcus sp. PRF04-17]
MDWLDAFLASGMRFTTPILLAGLGGLATAWTRDLNVGLEGIMIFGAFFGVVVGLFTGSSLAALAVVAVLGLLCGMIFGYLITVLRVNVFVAGIVLNVLGAGGTVYLLRSMYGVKGTLSDPGIPPLPKLHIPGVEDVPVLGGILSGHTVLTYLSWTLVLLLALAVRHTVVVRHLKAAGEHPAALATAGGNVTWMRVVAQAWCFALCGLAGLQLSLGQLTLFTEGMTSGLGFVALAAVIFCRGRVGLLAVMSVGFGLSSAASVQINEDVMPPQFAQMIPYIVALIGLIVLARTSREGATRIATPVMES